MPVTMKPTPEIVEKLEELSDSLTLALTRIDDTMGEYPSPFDKLIARLTDVATELREHLDNVDFIEGVAA